MNDLSNYFSQQDLIKELTNQVKHLKNELRLQRKRTAHYKAKWRMAIGEHETPTDKARKLIRPLKQEGCAYGGVAIHCKRIAKEVGLSFQAVRALWYEKF